MKPIDSMIFDMDGTLWDAVDTYCRVWDSTFAALGIRREPVRYEELRAQMGKPLEDIFDAIAAPDAPYRKEFFTLLPRIEVAIEPILGGKIYPGVRDALTVLHNRGIRLFMVSNCLESGLDNFYEYSGFGALFTDRRTYGGTGHDKDINLCELRNVYKLERPVYVGDIQRDCDSTHKAGMEFVWASYGFGTCACPDFTIRRFDDLLKLI